MRHYHKHIRGWNLKEKCNIHASIFHIQTVTISKRIQRIHDIVRLKNISIIHGFLIHFESYYKQEKSSTQDKITFTQGLNDEFLTV